MRIDSAQQPITTFFASIADPDVFCGGGSVAAIAAAGAASTALLVMRIDQNRRVNQPEREQIAASISRTETIINRLYDLADSDIATLDVLLAAQRNLKAGEHGGQERYETALGDAARSPLAIGDASLELLRLIEAELPRAARFTVSDLGAAAVLMEGACRAAFLTAEVNIVLLREISDSEQAIPDAIDLHRSESLKAIIELAGRIETATHRRIHLPSARVV